MTEHAHVIVVGGGYAGVMAANRLTRHTGLRVTLINPRATFVERIRLHQLVGGSDDALVDYQAILADRIRLVVDTVTGINAAERSLTLTTGGSLDYSYLVYALGSGGAGSTVPGASEFAYPITTFEQATRLRAALEATPATAAVTVVGAGPSGIETAAELAELGRTVTLVCGDQLGPYLHPKARRSIAGRLAQLGVTVIEGHGCTVRAVMPDAVELDDRRTLQSKLTIWTAGFGVPDLAARSGLSTDAVGRLLTDETLTSVDDEHIVAAGDSAAPSDLPFRMSCQAAGPLGVCAAETVLSRLAGESPAPIAMAFVGQCISLGRRAGIMQLSHRDDTATRLYIGGRAGATIKEFVCWGTVKQLVLEARRPGSYVLPTWLADGRRRQMLAAESDAAVAG